MTRIFAESLEKVEVSGVATSSSSNQTRITKASMGNIYAGMGVSYKTGASAATIPDNSYITSTSHSSNYVTMSNNSGQTDSDHTVIFNKSNYNVPTNPKFRTFGAYSSNERLYTVILDRSHAGDAEEFVQQLATGDSADTEYPNLETTEGNKIISFDFNSRAGVELDMNLSTHHYFVLIHSDDHLKHHFAKITSTVTENNFHMDGLAIENTVIGFEFEPKLGTEIERDTKFMVFKGPTTSNSMLIAASAGIKKDLQDFLVCAEPLFYFFDNGYLDKDDELNHNTKYFMKFKGDNATTVAPNVTNTFVTCQDNRKVVKDYGKFTHNLTMIDNLKKLDGPDYHLNGNSPLALTNEYAGSNILSWNETTDFTNYNECFPNARRDYDNDVYDTNSLDTYGPKRYIHYDFSPTRTNKTYNVFDLTLEDSIGNRGSFIEAKVLDSKRIMPTKVTNGDKIRIRHRLHKGKFNDWFALKAKIKSSLGSNEYRFTTEYDLSTMFYQLKMWFR